MERVGGAVGKLEKFKTKRGVNKKLNNTVNIGQTRSQSLEFRGEYHADVLDVLDTNLRAYKKYHGIKLWENTQRKCGQRRILGNACGP